MLLVRHGMTVFMNGTRSSWDCCGQFYALFSGAEYFNWLVIDTAWVFRSENLHSGKLLR